MGEIQQPKIHEHFQNPKSHATLHRRPEVGCINADDSDTFRESTAAENVVTEGIAYGRNLVPRVSLDVDMDVGTTSAYTSSVSFALLVIN